MANLLLVALGGALGAMARFAVGALLARRYGVGWPYGTFFINISGCLVIGVLLPLLTRTGVHEAWRHLLPIGFVGAYTTFSTFEYEALALAQSGAWRSFASYVMLSNGVGFFAVWLGVLLGKKL